MSRRVFAIVLTLTLAACSSYDTYRWDKGGAPVAMMPVSDGICALKKVAGRFGGTGDWVEVKAVNGVWTLQGAAQHAGTMGEAHCVSKQNFRFAQQIDYNQQTTAVWSQTPSGYEKVSIAPNDSWNCWLMGFGGDLAAQGGLIQIDVGPTPPSQSLSFHQYAPVRPLFASSVCLSTTPAPKKVSMGWGGTQTQPVTLPATAEAFCYLTYLAGQFTGTTPDRMTYAGISSSDWNSLTKTWKGQFLTAGNVHGQPGSLTVGVSCIYFNP